jgi:hypothetical protein
MTAIATLPLSNAFSILRPPSLDTPPPTPDDVNMQDPFSALGMVLRSKRVVPDPTAPPTPKKRRSRKRKSANKKPTTDANEKPNIPLTPVSTRPLSPIMTTSISPVPPAYISSQTFTNPPDEPIIGNKDIKSEEEVERLCTVLNSLEMEPGELTNEKLRRKGNENFNQLAIY